MESTMTRAGTGPAGAATLLTLFEESVRAYPGNVAVSDDHERLTYRELDQRSTQLAMVLRERGIGTEDRVGVTLDRSVDLFVAILAIVRSRACYVAVDLRYPDARRDLMLRAAGCKLVITRPENKTALEHLDTRVLGLRGTPSA